MSYLNQCEDDMALLSTVKKTSFEYIFLHTWYYISACIVF